MSSHNLETLVTISLPLTAPMHESIPQPSVSRESPGPPAKQSPSPEQKPRRVLVMDDEESILELTGRMLRSHHYDVETARDANTALKQYRTAMEAGRSFDAVILDLTMAEGMGGIDAFKALKALDPNVKAILSTGYSHESVVLNYKSFGIAGLALKPYRIQDLLGAVEGVMAER